jgi:hypothetical protein
MFHPYIELWCDSIIKSISENSTILHESVAYVDI